MVWWDMALGVFRCSGVNYDWIVENSLGVMNRVDFLNRGKVKSVATYDFSTLYTSIPHEELRVAIAWAVDKALNSGYGSTF